MKLRFKKYFSEFLGTMLLVFFGCGASIAVGIDHKKGVGYLLTALAFGLALTVLYYGISRISGCHLNPAVSLSMLIVKRIDIFDFIGYLIAQFAGAFAACGIMTYIFWGRYDTYGSNVIYNNDPFASILIEVILTTVFVCLVLFTSKNEKGTAGIMQGLALLFVHVFGIQFTGTSVNPARSLAPAVFAGGDALREVWVFIVAPLLGAALAALIFLIFDEKDEKHSEKQKIETEEALTVESTAEENTEKSENE